MQTLLWQSQSLWLRLDCESQACLVDISTASLEAQMLHHSPGPLSPPVWPSSDVDFKSEMQVQRSTVLLNSSRH